MLLSEFDFLPIYKSDLAGLRTLSFERITIIHYEVICFRIKQVVQFLYMTLLTLASIFWRQTSESSRERDFGAR